MGPQRVTILLSAFLAADGASMNVHSVVGQRAHAYYAGIVETHGVSADRAAAYDAAVGENLPSVLAGADFPDFLYACGSYADHHDAGEAAHWPVWHAAAVTYLREAVPNFAVASLWSDATKKLVAFLFGSTVHYVTDELWEGLTDELAEQRSFVELLDAYNLGMEKGVDVDESITNMAGEFYAAWILNETSIAPWQREFPIDDIVEIYKLTPKMSPNATGNFSDVTAASIAECKAVFDLGLWALQTFGAELYPLWNEILYHVPLVTESLFETVASGVDDMAALTTYEWARLASWLETGAPPAASAPPRIAAAAAKNDAGDRSTFALMRALQPHLGAVEAIKALPRGARLFEARPGATIASEGGSGSSTPVLRYIGPPALEEHIVAMLEAVARNYYGDAAVARLGVLRAAEERGSESSASASTSTSVIDTASTQRVLPSAAAFRAEASASLNGSAAAAYFGRTLISGDFDGDGNVDLVIGAPGAGGRGAAPRSGRVEIVYGDGTVVELRGAALGAVARFGDALAVVDINLDGVDDLAVGAPGASGFDVAGVNGDTPYPFDKEPLFRMHGRVVVFFGAKGRRLDANARCVALSPSPPVLPPRCQASPRLLTYALSAPSTSLTLRSNVTFGTFGTTLLGDATLGLIATSPGANRHYGAVYVIAPSVSRWRAGTVVDVDSAAAVGAGVVAVHGPATDPVGGWFGSAIAVAGDAQSGLSRVLLVGAPYARYNASCVANYSVAADTFVGCAVVGGIFAFDVANLAKSAPPLFFLRGSNGTQYALGRFGHAIATSADVVAIGAPSASTLGGVPRAGAVLITSAAALLALRGDVAFDSLPLRTTIVGATRAGRFGEHILLADLDGDGASELIVGAPLHGASGGFLVDDRELGSVHAWHGASLPTGDVNSSSAQWSVRGDRSRARMGVALAPLGGGRIAVGSPNAAANGDQTDAPQTGAVDVLSPFAAQL